MPFSLSLPQFLGPLKWGEEKVRLGVLDPRKRIDRPTHAVCVGSPRRGTRTSRACVTSMDCACPWVRAGAPTGRTVQQTAVSPDQSARQMHPITITPNQGWDAYTRRRFCSSLPALSPTASKLLSGNKWDKTIKASNFKIENNVVKHRMASR